MKFETSRPRQALWNRLKPRYKLVASSPCIVGLVMLCMTIFPGGWLLANLLGISADEPVIRNHNGSLFMLVFCTSMPVAFFVGIGIANRVLGWWLVRFSSYSPQEVRLALAWRAYPEAWFAGGTDR